MTIRWTLVDYGHSWMPGYLRLAFESDVPCHVTLRRTQYRPKLREVTELRRGLRKIVRPRYSFYTTKEFDQLDAGDTLYHTFDMTKYPTLTRHYFHFIATAGGEPTPSNSGIFQVDQDQQEEAISMRHIDLVDKEVAGVIDHADASIPPEKLTGQAYQRVYLHTPFHSFNHLAFEGAAGPADDDVFGWTTFKTDNNLARWLMPANFRFPTTLVGTIWKIKCRHTWTGVALGNFNVFDHVINILTSGFRFDFRLATHPTAIVHRRGVEKSFDFGDIGFGFHEYTFKIVLHSQTDIYLDRVKVAELPIAPTIDKLWATKLFALELQSSDAADIAFDIAENYLAFPEPPL
ncbi:hypothetical protein ES703_37184 [subsurface metagenome]